MTGRRIGTLIRPFSSSRSVAVLLIALGAIVVGVIGAFGVRLLVMLVA